MVARGRHAWLLLGGMRGCSRGGMHGCSQGGMHGCSGGVCVVAPGGHAWLLPGGVCVRYRDTVNELAVRILLECILVKSVVPQINEKQKEIFSKYPSI